MRLSHRYWIITLGALLLHPRFAFSQDAIDVDPQTTIEAAEESYERSFDDNPYVDTSEPDAAPVVKKTAPKKQAKAKAKAAVAKKKKAKAKAKAAVAKKKAPKKAAAPKVAAETKAVETKPVETKGVETAPATDAVSKSTETSKTVAEAEKAEKAEKPATEAKIVEEDLPTAAPAVLELSESGLQAHGTKRIGIFALATLALGSSAALLLRRRRHVALEAASDDAEEASYLSRLERRAEPKVSSGF